MDGIRSCDQIENILRFIFGLIKRLIVLPILIKEWSVNGRDGYC